jgi:beta-phosphoglucomutase-like phosphatase (HAD superfamily)
MVTTSSSSSSSFPQAILFDMDGTLLDSEPLGCKAVYKTLEQYVSAEAKQQFKDRGYLMEWTLKQQTLGLPGPQWSAIVLEWAKLNWCHEETKHSLPSVPQFLDVWDNHMYELVESVEECKGATELVNSLATSTNIPLAIATSSHSQSVSKKRMNHELMFSKFTTILSVDDPSVKKGKPSPDIYLEAAKRCNNANPTQCIVLEDGLPGVLAGKAAGCFVIAIPDPRFSEEEKQEIFESNADLVLEDLTQFDLQRVIESAKRKGVIDSQEEEKKD